MRRLPVYLLIDCSESMAGTAIETINLAVPAMVRELRSMPHALETVAMSVITFSGDAQLVIPLTSLEMFQFPALKIRPGTSLGRALDMLAACISTDVVTTTKERKGDWLPLVFIFTDGQPTDDWRGAAARIKELTTPKVIDDGDGNTNITEGMSSDRLASPKITCIYAIGCGDDVDFSVLHEITNSVFKTSDVDAEAIRDAFVWITASVQRASVGVAGGLNCLPEPPAGCGLKEVPKDNVTFSEREPRQVFIHARCNKTGGDYLMRFVRENDGDAYIANTAHKLDGNGAGFRAELPPVQSSRLIGVMACPYCGNENAAMCGCGGVMCLDINHSDGVVCPHCGTKQQGSFTVGNFDIRQSAG
jgi:uncharacterized protein YegL